MGRKGGIESGKARREKRDLQKMAKLFFEVHDGLTEEEKARADQNLGRWVEEIMKRG